MYKISQDIETEPVTTADVKQYLKVSETNTAEDALIADMIKAARVYFEKRTGLALAEKTIIEYFNKESSGQYVLNVAPIVSVNAVVLLDLEETETAWVLNENYYLTGLYERIIMSNDVSDNTTLKVTYKAGYGETETETLPYDIKNAILRQTLQWYDNRDEFIEGTYLNTVSAIIRSYQRKW